MAEARAPEWFRLTDAATTETMRRLAALVQSRKLPLQVQFLPTLAHWFVLDSLFSANKMNKEGMHAPALALTRQCIEAMSVLELGLSDHPEASSLLLKWDSGELTPGSARKWLSTNLWAKYGSGLWTEPWSDFMSHLAGAVQPYAHYTTQLAKWQLRLHAPPNPGADPTLIIELTPRAYDPQKATRITLFHSILTFALARIWIAHSPKPDLDFAAQINRLRVAIGKSKYLDGHSTNWEHQFWATVFSKDGGTILE